MGKKVDDTTIIQFTLKWFITTVLSLLISFGGFYLGIQKPDNESIKTYMDDKMTSEREYQDLKFEKLDEIVSKLDDLDKMVTALNKRNSDLNEIRARNNDTGASLGDN